MSFTDKELNEFSKRFRAELDNYDIKRIRDGQFQVKRNLLMALVILQKVDYIIKIQKLVRTIGGSHQKDVFDVLRTLEPFVEKAADPLEEVALTRQEWIIFDERFLKEIKLIFDEPKYWYNLTKPLEYFDGTSIGLETPDIKGQDFLAWVNLLDEKHPLTSRQLTQLIMRSFRNFDRAIKGEILESRDNNHPVCHMYNEQQNWHFLFLVFIKTDAISEADINQIIVNFTFVRNEVKRRLKLSDEALKMLIICPSIDLDEVYQLVVEYDHLYHFWTMSLMRFFNQLRSIDTPDNHQALADNFHFFIPQESTASFRSKDAIERLEKKI